MGWVPYTYRCRDVRPIRFSWPSAAAQRQFAECVDLRALKRPSAAFLLRARAKMAENDGKTFSNFSLKTAIGEDRSVNAKALFQWSLRPFCSPETGKKNIIYKSTISQQWCAYGLNAAVERRHAAKQPLIPYRLASSLWFQRKPPRNEP